MNRETVKCIEKNLRLYRTYEATIANCKRQLDYMLPSAVISYDFNSGGGGFMVSTTERSALDRLESKKAIDLHEAIERYTLIIQSIDSAIKCLDDTERQFIEYRYFKNLSLEECAEAIKYSLRTVFVIKKEALEKLTISLVNILSL